MPAPPTGELAALVGDVQSLAATVHQRFGPLSAAQLNWKPSPDRWSVAQCLDHLVTTNASYFPTFEQVLGGRHAPTLWQRMPWLPRVFGRLVRQAVHPDSVRAHKAPAIFGPASSGIDADIVTRFVDQQARVIDVLTRSAGLDLDATIIASPVSALVVYSLFDAFRIVVTHEQRHVNQAIRVTETDGFPA
jgi:hypothetical protein